MLGQLAHPNIVSLLGFCLHGDENVLVYEYLENRTLDAFLFTSNVNKILYMTIMVLPSLLC